MLPPPPTPDRCHLLGEAKLEIHTILDLTLGQKHKVLCLALKHPPLSTWDSAPHPYPSWTA